MREMKASGISWLGELPSNWELRKIKYCLQERVEKNNPVRTTEILSLTAKQGVIPYDQKEGGGNKPKEDVSAYRLAYPGDIVMNSMNILSGSVGLSQYFGCVSPVYYMLLICFALGMQRKMYATITISFRQRCFNAVCLDLEMAFLLKNLEMEN